MTDSEKASIKSKWSNFWYYYKTRVIVIAFGVFVFIFLLSSLFTKDKVDLRIFYVTGDPVVFTEKITNLTKAIKEYTPDLNGDGKTVVSIENIYVGENHDNQSVINNKKRLMTILRTGDSMFLIADKIGMEYLIEAGSLADISDIATEMNYGGMGWLANGSEFMKQEISGFEDDLYMGLRVYQGTIAELLPDSQKYYEFSKEVLTRIINNEKVKINEDVS